MADNWQDKFAIQPTGPGGAPEAWQDKFAVTPTAVQAKKAAPYEVSGAPYQVRLAVGTARPQDRLATLQAYFPDAEAVEGGNFVYTDPATGKRTLYNPHGLDPGDVPSVTREAAESVGGAAGAVAGLAGGLPGALLGAGTGTAAAGKAVDLARSATGLPQSYSPADTAADVGWGAAGEAGGRALGEAGRAFAHAAIRPGAQATMQAAQRANVPLTASMVGRGPYALGEHSAAAVLPVSRPARTANKLYDAATSRLEAARPRPATVDPSNLAEAQIAAGGALKEGADTAHRNFRRVRQRLDDDFYQAMPRGVKLKLPSVAAAAQGFQAEIARAPGSAPARLGPAMEAVQRLQADLAANGGALPPDLLRRNRRDLGELLEVRATTELPASSQTALRDLYSALNTDLRAGAAAVSPRAERALARQDRLVRAFRGEDLGRESTAGSLDAILKAKSDEAAWTAFQSKAGGVDRLRTLVRRMSPEERRIVARANWERLTRTGNGNPRGPVEWASQWQAMPQESKRLMFGGLMDTAQLDDLAQVLRAQTEGARGKNWSGTAYELQRTKLYQSIWDAIKGAAGVGGASYASSAATGMNPVEEIASGAASGYFLSALAYNPRLIRALTEAAGSLGTPTGPKTRAVGQASGQYLRDLLQGQER